jgi:5-methylcytosine-specific restriction endonuclease McrA
VSPDDTTMKRCPKCGQTKPSNEFNKNRSRKDGLADRCKTCRNEYRQTNVERLNEYAREYYARNPERINARQREYNSTHKDRIAARKRDYYFSNKERIKEYRSANADRMREQSRIYRVVNADRIRERKRTYRQSEHGKAGHRAESHKRRSRIVAAGGMHTANDIGSIRRAQTDKRGRLICWWCSRPIHGNYHIDHRIPLTRGGSNDPGNLVISCPTCNLRKHDKLPQEWNGRLL